MDQQSKPKFDKKKWREKKYDRKVQAKDREDKQKFILKQKLQRQLKKENPSAYPLFNPDDLRSGAESSYQEKPRKLSQIKMAQLEYKKKQETKQKMREQRLKKKEEIAQALQNYRLKKLETNKVLNKKTKRGQPLMKGRMQLLFEKVKQTVGTSS
ncbi:rRNA processing [Nesidiocoris tenuis]|uniref:rRNA processing n=1 Tax=Nesidiocoris tenuis TaxID=355587 RepID=A0ABN7ASP9_9HEMI|nr:rRNA processing [Nesidiocoris tenuis]